MIVRFEADQSAKGRKQKRQCQHDRNDGGRDIQLDDHHPVECAHQKHQRHADRDLK
jgi:hypothetical protein